MQSMLIFGSIELIYSNIAVGQMYMKLVVFGKNTRLPLMVIRNTSKQPHFSC